MSKAEALEAARLKRNMILEPSNLGGANPEGGSRGVLWSRGTEPVQVGESFREPDSNSPRRMLF